MVKGLYPSFLPLYFRHIYVAVTMELLPKHNGMLPPFRTLTEPVDEELRGYKSSWPRHVTRMNSNWMPNVMLNYGPNGGRRLGRHFEETIRGGRNRSIKA
jgi:hypothetical protein